MTAAHSATADQPSTVRTWRIVELGVGVVVGAGTCIGSGFRTASGAFAV